MTEDDLKAIEAREKAATKGPWTRDMRVVGYLAGKSPAVAVRYDDGDGSSPVCMVQPHLSGYAQTAGSLRPVEDADFIAHAS